MNELEEIIKNLQDNITMLKDVTEELSETLFRLRIMEGVNQMHTESIDNECMGDMQ